MSFFQEYKKLDKLLRDMYSGEPGVTSYIEEMEKYDFIFPPIIGWGDDLKKLKRYRHIRNQIAHDTDADEEMLCTPDDEEWLRSFYKRIINRTDPLSLNRARITAAQQAQRSQPQNKQIQTTTFTPNENSEPTAQNKPSVNDKKPSNGIGLLLFLTFIAILTIFVALFLYITMFII